MKKLFCIILVLFLLSCFESETNIPMIVPGKTQVRAIIDENTIGFYDASRSILYVDSENKDRVLNAMNAKLLRNKTYSISRGKHFIAQGAYLEINRIRAFSKLNQNTTLGLNDAKAVKDFVCTLRKPGRCVNKLESTEPDAKVKFSFNAPSYGMSLCVSTKPEEKEECVSWLAKETVTKYPLRNCKGIKTTEEVECLVCSLF